jgi:hypothetical protein
MDCVELSDSAMEIVNQSLGGQPLQYVLPSWRNYSYLPGTTGTGSTTISMPIPAKFSSLKSIIVGIRDQGLGAASYFPFSSVSLGAFNNYFFRIGSDTLPSRAPYSVTECAAEVMKALGCISETSYLANSDQLTWSVRTNNAVSATSDVGLCALPSGTFYVGIDLESYPNADKSSIFSGRKIHKIAFLFSLP